MAPLNTAHEEPRVTLVCLHLRPVSDTVKCYPSKVRVKPPGPLILSTDSPQWPCPASSASLLQNSSPVTPMAPELRNWEQQQTTEAEPMVSSFPDSHGAALLLPQASLSLAVTLRKKSPRSPSPWPLLVMRHGLCCRDTRVPQLTAAALFHFTAAQQPQGRMRSRSALPAAVNARGVSGTLGWVLIFNGESRLQCSMFLVCSVTNCWSL